MLMLTDKRLQICPNQVKKNTELQYPEKIWEIGILQFAGITGPLHEYSDKKGKVSSLVQ